MGEQARLERLVERALERRHQAVRQLVDEADGVGHQDARVRLGGTSGRTVVSSVANSLSAT